MPKRNAYHSRGDFFWAKRKENETPKEYWRKLVSLDENCEFKDIKQENLPISKFITSIIDTKNTGNLIREKTLSLKTTMDLVTQDSYEKRHKQSKIPTELVKKKRNKTRTNTKNTKNYRTNNNTFTGNLPQKRNDCGFCGQQILTPLHKCPAKTAAWNKWHKLGQEYAAAIPRTREKK